MLQLRLPSVRHLGAEAFIILVCISLGIDEKKAGKTFNPILRRHGRIPREKNGVGNVHFFGISVHHARIIIHIHAQNYQAVLFMVSGIESFSTIRGCDIKQGPHQVAQKSSITGWPRNCARETLLPERSLSSKPGACMEVVWRLAHPTIKKTAATTMAALRILTRPASRPGAF